MSKKDIFLRCARAVLRRENRGRYPELDWDTFREFNNLMGVDCNFRSQDKELLSLMLCFMAAMAESGDL